MTPTFFFFKLSSKLSKKLGCWDVVRRFYLPLFHEKVELESMDEAMRKLAGFTPPYLENMALQYAKIK